MLTSKTESSSLISKPVADEFWVRTGAGVVFPNACDLDHRIHRKHYFDVLDDSSFLFWDEIGIGRRSLRQQGLSSVMARYDLSVHGLVEEGSALAVRTRVARVGRKSVRLVHEIVDVEAGITCASGIGTHVFFDLEKRRSAVIPDDTRSLLSARSNETAGEDDQPDDGTATLDSEKAAEAVKWESVAEGTVEAEKCDHLGHLNARFHVHTFEDAIACAPANGERDGGPIIRSRYGDRQPVEIRIDYQREVLCGTDYRVLRAYYDDEDQAGSGHLRLVDRERDVALSDYRWRIRS